MKTKQELQAIYNDIQATRPPDSPDIEYRLLYELVNSPIDTKRTTYVLLEALIEAYKRIEALEQRLGSK